ncbi:MAG: hypothetical protein M3O70_07755 [Actinomycetota bacterium]|nr:hypothetical protein [Actinomycetota bacterium]
MRVETRAEHFSDWDRDRLIEAGQTLMAWAWEWVFHEHDGTTWYRDWTDDPVETAEELQHIFAQAHRALRQARCLANEAASAARLRALAEQRRQEERRHG